MSKPIVHLHCHTDASTLHSIDGMNSVRDLVKFAKDSGAEAIAITDHGCVANHVAFWEACKKEGVKPILGCEFYIVPSILNQKDSFGRGKSNHITVLARNKTGWTNIIKMISIANSPEFFYTEPRIDWETLVKHKEGLIILSGCPKGMVAKPFVEDDPEMADLRAAQMVAEFGDSFYFEVQDYGIRGEDGDINQKDINDFMRVLSLKYNRPTVFTQDAHFASSDQAHAHKCLLGVMMRKKLDELGDYKGSDQAYLKTTKECLKMDCTEDEINASRDIAELVEEFEIGIGGRNLPKFDLEEGQTPMGKLRELALAGWKRLGIDKKPNKQEYTDRMKQELADIEQVGMAEYFLLVHDVVSYGKSKGIRFGSGRGSAGGSLTLYLLGVTGEDLDPIRWGLIWERFYNVGRSASFPDVDIDVSVERRSEIIDYIVKRFGEDRVAQLITYSRMTARAVLKFVMKVYGIDFEEANRITKLVPEKDDDHSTDIPIKKALAKSPELAKYVQVYPEIFEVAQQLESKYHGYGIHAAAVIINDRSFSEGNLPLVRDRKGNKQICGWSMEEVDKLGYLKLDILGLNELDIVDETLRLIEERHGRQIPFEGFPINEPDAFKMFPGGHTEGIFQLRSNLGRIWGKRIKPTSVEDIADITSLIRPACLDAGMTDRYARIREGRESESYIHDDLKPILGPTRSVYVYQEQALRICQMVGMDLKEADIVRKAIGKKKPELLAKQEARFMELALQKYDEDIAKQFWNYIKEGAGYGFNRCCSGNTLVTRASANQHQGANVKISDLWEYFHGSKKRTPAGKKYRNSTHAKLGLRILAMKDNRIKIDRVKDVIKTGVKTTYEMKLDTGHTIRATLDHKFFTVDGWKTLGDIQVGDVIRISGEYEDTTLEEYRRMSRFSHTTVDQRQFKKKVPPFAPGSQNTGYIDGAFTQYKTERENRVQTIRCCEQCGNQSSRYEMAHLDGDHTNQDPDNLKLMCVSCHKKHDYRVNGRTCRFGKGYPIESGVVVSIGDPREEMTYDIEMCGDEHNYIANGIITHNSHAIAYSILSYKNAWLKANYPIEFFCANMRKCQNLGDKHKAFDRIKEYVNDAKINGIKVTPPSIQQGNMDFDIIDDNRIAFGMSHIHGVGQAALKAVKKCSGTDDFYEFIKLTFKHGVNRRVVEGIILSGAADDFAMPRKQMLLEYQTVANLSKKEKEYTLQILTDEGILPVLEQMADDDNIKERKKAGEHVPNVTRRAKIRDVYEELYAQSSFHDDKEWNLRQEEEYLGTALSGSFEDVYSYLPATSHTCLDLLNPNEDEHVELCVRINSVRKARVRASGAEMAFVSISDKTYTLNDIPIFSKKYAKYKHIIEPGKVVHLKGFFKDGLKIYNIQEVSTSKSGIF